MLLVVYMHTCMYEYIHACIQTMQKEIYDKNSKGSNKQTTKNMCKTIKVTPYKHNSYLTRVSANHNFSPCPDDE